METSKMKKIKRKIFNIIQIGNKTDVPSWLFDIFISVVIILSISVTFLQTFESLKPIRPVLSTIEYVTIVIFVIEYLLRIWTADLLYENCSRPKAVSKFVISFYGIVDFLTIFSYFLPFLFSNGMVALRMLRVVRIMRLFKLNSSYDAFNVIIDVLKDKRDQILSSVFMVIILMLASSMCMYSLEHDAQPENFNNAFSGIWWSASTLLTVGYGDIYPITLGGKIMAIFISFLGVGMVAIPTGIISAGFVEYFSRVKNGSYSQKESDYVVVEVDENMEYKGKRIKEIKLPNGLFVAVVMRGNDILTPNPELIINENDNLIVASTSGIYVNARMEEVTLEQGHSWIDKPIKDLDISRQVFIMMIKRKSKIVKPEGNTILKQGDVIALFDRR